MDCVGRDLVIVSYYIVLVRAVLVVLKKAHGRDKTIE